MGSLVSTDRNLIRTTQPDPGSSASCPTAANTGSPLLGGIGQHTASEVLADHGYAIPAHGE